MKLNESLGFMKRTNSAGTQLSENPTNKTNVDETHIKKGFVDGTIVNWTRQRILLSLSLSAPPGFKSFEEPTSILNTIMFKNKIGGILFLSKRR